MYKQWLGVNPTIDDSCIMNTAAAEMINKHGIDYWFAMLYARKPVAAKQKCFLPKFGAKLWQVRNKTCNASVTQNKMALVTIQF